MIRAAPATATVGTRARRELRIKAVTACQATAAIFREVGGEHNERRALGHLDEARTARQAELGR